MIVTLTTDFGLKDHFVGVMKGAILAIVPQVQIVDICHQVSPQNIFHAHLLVNASYPYFAKGTLHLIVVDPGVGSERRILYVEANGHSFLAPDNGVLSFLDEKEIICVYTIENRRFFAQRISATFHGRDIFAPIAGHLANGISPKELGNPITPAQICRATIAHPIQRRGRICGQIIYIDAFGNLITNIAEQQLPPNPYFIIQGRHIHSLCGSYSQVDAGECLAVINSFGLLEIAQNRGNAQKILGATVGTAIEVLAQKPPL